MVWRSASLLATKSLPNLQSLSQLLTIPAMRPRQPMGFSTRHIEIRKAIMSKLDTTQRNELWNRVSDLLAQEGPLYADMDDDEADELLTKFIDGIERDILPTAERAPAPQVPTPKHEGPGHAYGDIFWCPGCLAEFRASQAKAEESL